MKRIILALLVAAGLGISAAPASAATSAELFNNAYTLTGAKCEAISSGCWGVTYTGGSASYYNPAGGFYSGSRRYDFTFKTWATRLNSSQGRYACNVYVRNTSYASGLVNCWRI